MVRRHWWWNRRWGHLGRHDVIIWEKDGRWAIEDRVGGADGRSRWREAPSEATALEWAAELRDQGQVGEWTPMPF